MITKEELQTLGELLDDWYYYEDRFIENSGSTSKEFYIKARQVQSDKFHKYQGILDKLEEAIENEINNRGV